MLQPISSHIKTKNNVYSIFGDSKPFQDYPDPSLLQHEEFQYLKHANDILKTEELLWFLRGQTDSKILERDNVNIWKDNASKEFLEKRGLKDYQEGDLGPIYGFQWRHFGAGYKNCHTDYSNKGIDQIKNLIEMIKKDPTSRRLIVSAWNPMAIDKMALPPCHVLSQFHVDAVKKEISCALYQRSGDWGLGVPFNIASYALLCHIIGKLTGYKPKELVHFVANAHIYANHEDSIRSQCNKVPNPFPEIQINHIDDIADITSNDIKLRNYVPKKAIKMSFVV
uniref:Thymidylate synthase n=1 Tax=Dermatophagoides pteronyssinus TaxID=6956 RepID=A0A6P6YCY2_DERPT|nr:thymidylate synthase-like [Dermatophagoides pteronyssinus]